MVDVRVLQASPDDRLLCALYVTVLARNEPTREENRTPIARHIAESLDTGVDPSDSMIELILTLRASTFRYRT